MNREEIKKALYAYHWTIKEISRIHAHLATTEFAGVAAGGIESVMPKGNGVGNPLLGEIIRREAKSKRLKRMEKQVNFIQSHIVRIEDETLATVADCILDGLTVSEVSRYLNVSRPTAHKYVDDIITEMLKN
jgi:hypothetical protein